MDDIQAGPWMIFRPDHGWYSGLTIDDIQAGPWMIFRLDHGWYSGLTIDDIQAEPRIVFRLGHELCSGRAGPSAATPDSRSDPLKRWVALTSLTLYSTQLANGSGFTACCHHCLAAGADTRCIVTSLQEINDLRCTIYIIPVNDIVDRPF